MRTFKEYAESQSNSALPQILEFFDNHTGRGLAQEFLEMYPIGGIEHDKAYYSLYEAASVLNEALKEVGRTREGY